MKKILVVDDDKPLRMAIKMMLRRQGYEVIDADNVTDGMSLAFVHRPNLVLSDVNMDGQSGFDFLKKLRAHPETSPIPVILMTGQPQEADARFSMDQGADDYLPKPFNMEQMLKTVSVRLQRQESISQAVEAQHQAERISTEESLQLLGSAVEQAKESIVITDATLDASGPKILFVNPAFTKITGYTAEEAIGKSLQILEGARTDKTVLGRLRQSLERGVAFEGETVNYRKDGKEFNLEWQIVPIRNGDGKNTHFVAIQRDITERKRLEAQLLQAQKLETVGQLAAGIAHEINTPTQYVGDNTRFVKDSFEAIHRVLKCHEELLDAIKKNGVTPELLKHSEDILAASDLEYLCQQIPSALAETLEGVERITKIVRAMKEFSHPGSKEKSPADLNKAIESTVTVAHNEWKYVAELKLELEPDLPLIPCFLGEFNQCILNLIVNAAHAIGDVVKDKPGTKGLITVRTRHDGDFFEARVSDTGTGIPEPARPHIFEPFFTTKEVGKGTGQGLSIIYGSIVKRHGGTVTFETEVGQGTTFIVRLPIKPKAAPEETPAGPKP